MKIVSIKNLHWQSQGRKTIAKLANNGKVYKKAYQGNSR